MHWHPWCLLEAIAMPGYNRVGRVGDAGPPVSCACCSARGAMDDKGLQQLLLNVLSPDADKAGVIQDAGSPECPPLSRLRSALLREDWTETEDRHRQTCPHCQRIESQARSHLWHPSLVPLFWHARGLFDDRDADLSYHLQTDNCHRCLRLVGLFQIDRVL